MDLSSGLRERERELGTLEEAIDAAHLGRGRVVVIEGPPGIGKTRLVAAARDRAAERGLRGLGARGGELERHFPYGIVRQLFESVVARSRPEDRQDLLSGVASLAAPLFEARALSRLSQAGEERTFATVHGLFWLTVNLAERQPLALVIDDLHWSDASSLRWLAYLAHRLDGLPILVVVSLRPDEPDVESALLAHVVSDPTAVVVRPAPLSGDAVASMVREALAPDAASGFCTACHLATGGNPFLVRELIGELGAEGVPPTMEEVARVHRMGPGRVAQAVLLRLARLPAEATSLAHAAAVLGDGATLGHAAALANLQAEPASQAVTLLGRADILRPEPPLTFVHPIVRTAIYRGLTLADREHAHARAAEILTEHGAPAEQIAAHLVLAAPAGRPSVVAELRAAAQRALSQGAAESAVAYLGRALAEPPEPPERAEVVYELGAAELLLHAPTAVEHLGEALVLTADRRRRGQIALALGRTMFFSGQGRQAVDVLDKAIVEVGDRDLDLRQRLEAAVLNVAIEDPVLYPLAADRLARLRREPPDASAGGRTLLAILAYQEARAGTSRADVVALAERARSGGPVNPDEGGAVFGFIANVLAHADRFDEATMVCEEALADARARGALFTFALASLLRGHAALLRGALADAEADARQALEAAESHGLDIGRPYALAKLADVLLARGDVDGAAQALGRLGLGKEVPDTGHLHWFLDTRARVRIQQGRTREGLTDLLELGRRFEAVGGRNPAIIAWRSEAALALLTLDDRIEARRLATEEVKLARRWAAPRPLGRALRAAGLVEGGAPGLKLLEEAVKVLRASPARLERARAATDLGAALRAANQRVQAREPLREAADLAHRCGATSLERRAHDELLAAGARPRRMATSGAEALTPSERRIASMAAQAMTNRDIAQALFVTPKTVEMHLHNVFTKLGINSRTQLPRAIAQPQGEGPR